MPYMYMTAVSDERVVVLVVFVPCGRWPPSARRKT